MNQLTPHRNYYSQRISSRLLQIYANAIADGYTNQEIAQRLRVQRHTVTSNIWRLRLRMRLPLPEFSRNEELPQTLRERGYGSSPKQNTVFATTFETIRSYSPCGEGWTTLCDNLGTDTGPVTLLQILDSNGVQDMIWALRCLDTIPATLYQIRHFAIFCAEQVLPIYEARYPDDARPRNAILAAKAVLEDDTPQTRNAAHAAANAADAAMLKDTYSRCEQYWREVLGGTR